MRSIRLLLFLLAACVDSRNNQPGECAPPIDVTQAVLQVRGSVVGNGPVMTMVVSSIDEETVRLGSPDGSQLADGTFVEIKHVGTLPAGAVMPGLGEEMEVARWSGCLDLGYARLSRPTGEIVFEGGDPACLDESDRLSWDPPPLARLVTPSPDRVCQTDGCVAHEKEIELPSEGGALLPLAVGQTREVEIEGRRYVAVVQLARALEPCGVIVDGEGVVGSSALVWVGD